MKTETQIKTEKGTLLAQWLALGEQVMQMGEILHYDDVTTEQLNRWDNKANELTRKFTSLRGKTLILAETE